MRRSSVVITGIALLALTAAAGAQTPTPPDTVATQADSVATPLSAPPPAATAPAATTTAAAAAPASPAKPPLRERLYYGGAIGFSFWGDYWRISLEPLVAMKMRNPKLSVGGKLRYEYINDNRGVEEFSSHNYGGSVFSRYRLIPQIYGHAELAYMTYDYPRGREGVPFLLLGGGYSQPLGKNMWSTVEVLWDVLNDDNSPYEEGQPVVSIGVGVGF